MAHNVSSIHAVRITDEINYEEQKLRHKNLNNRAMEISLGKHVKLICNLEIGQTVRIDGWGYKFDGKFFKIQDVKKKKTVNPVLW